MTPLLIPLALHLLDTPESGEDSFYLAKLAKQAEHYQNICYEEMVEKNIIDIIDASWKMELPSNTPLSVSPHFQPGSLCH
jgi:hypothetical protein